MVVMEKYKKTMSEQIKEMRESVLGELDDGVASERLEERIAVRVVLMDKDGKIGICLAKKSERPHYKLPGGSVEKGEDIEVALRRETEEESGYTLSGIQPVGVFFERLGKFDRENVSYVFMGVVGSYMGQKLTEYEKRAGFELEWFDNLDEAIKRVTELNGYGVNEPGKFFFEREGMILSAIKKENKNENFTA